MTDCEQQEPIKLTPEMLRAGVEELREKHFGENIEEIVRSVYLAMVIASESIASK